MDRVKEVIPTVTFNFGLLTPKIIGFPPCVYQIQSLYEIQSFLVGFFSNITSQITVDGQIQDGHIEMYGQMDY